MSPVRDTAPIRFPLILTSLCIFLVKPYTQSREFLEKSKREEPLHYLALPAAAASAFLAAFSCKAFPSLSRRCSGVRPSSLVFNFPPFLAAAFSLSFSLWFPLVICPSPLKDTKPNHQRRESLKQTPNTHDEESTEEQRQTRYEIAFTKQTLTSIMEKR
jgi:hypothetical protein